jgi:hypothetical protein
MDFVTQLPVTVSGYDAIFVVVDRLTKLARLIPCKTETNAEEMAKLFLDHWYSRGFGLPDDIVSDRDSRFTGRFWQDLCRQLGTKVKLSTAYHPQTDGQTERMNRTMEDMLRHYVGPTLKDWDRHLPLVEFAYNSSMHESIGTTPYKAALGLDPKVPMDVVSSKLPAVEDLVTELGAIESRVRDCLEQAQARQKTHADEHRRPAEFSVDDRVLLSTKNLQIKGSRKKAQRNRKLLPKYVGPFVVVERVGRVAYRLDLPSTMKVHPVFHVSLLVRYRDGHRYGRPPPAVVYEDGSVEEEVDAVLDHRVSGSRKKRKLEYLISWKGLGPEHRSWEPERHLGHSSELVVEYWERSGGRAEALAQT